MIELKRIDKDFHFIATNPDGNEVHIDGAESIGGHGMGARPMQLLLMGVGGCSSIDIINILRKQKLELDDLSIKVDSTRVDAVPAIFETITVKYYLEGDIPETKAKRAVELSMEKYCSVSIMLEKACKIEYEVYLNGTLLD